MTKLLKILESVKGELLDLSNASLVTQVLAGFIFLVLPALLLALTLK